MSAVCDWNELAGYADRLSAVPGERLTVMASGPGRTDARAVELPSGEPAPVAIRKREAVEPQAVRGGSHVAIPHDPRLRPAEGLSVRTWVWLAPDEPGGRRRGLIATWGDDGDGYALVLDPDDVPAFELGANGARYRVRGAAAVRRGAWTRLEAILDPTGGTISLQHLRREGRRLRAIDSAVAKTPLEAPGRSPGPLLLGAEPAADGEAQAHLDGKLDQPVLGRPGGGPPLAAWSLGSGRSSRVDDDGPAGLHGRCVNGPLRAVTGHRWSGDVDDWRLAPDAYSAMHFHSDAIDDLRWPAAFELDLPPSLASGVYALVLECDGFEDAVAFAVRRPPGTPPAANVLLLPTFTYLAYSCERAAPPSAGSTRSEDRWTATNGLLSLYDRHRDGVGVYEASLRRPLTQLRPGYRCAQHGGPHGLAQDLILIGWLRRRGIEFDLVTDHDLDREGAAALSGHRTLITGAHPEYASARLLDAIDDHLELGGNLAYLGGNGLNGPVSVDPARPHVLELRRSDTQGLAWQALPGEHRHAGGGHGADWRRLGRPEHATLGVGLSAFGEAPARPYRRPAGGEHPSAAVVFAGIDREASIGGRGEVLGNAAGYEVDAFDPRCGSPEDGIVLASAQMGDGYRVWADDVIGPPDGGAGRHGRADMVLHHRPGGGAVFAAGSIAWTGCLIDDDGPVSRVTENVLRELARDLPFAEARQDE